MLWEIRAQMKPVLAVIDMIPDIHRTAALNTLRRAVHEGRPKIQPLSDEEKELAYYDAPVQLTSPIGARILRDLYKRGDIKLKKPPQKSLPTLEAYIATEAAFRTKIAEIVAADEAASRRLDEIIQNPEAAEPSELSPQLIARVMNAHLGYGALGEMKIAGLECHRSESAPDSADGRMRAEGRILCWWLDAEGQRHGDME